MHRSTALALGLLSSAAILGCTQQDDPLPPADVHAQVETHVGTLLGQVHASISNSWNVVPRPDVLGLLERVVGVDTPVARLVHQLAIQLEPAPEIDARAATAYLTEQLFAEASYLGDGLYEVAPAVVCGDDPTCAARVAPLALRLRATLPPLASDTGIVVAVQIGANHDEPLELTLRAEPSLTVTSVTAKLDLDALQRALAVLPAGDLPHTALSGQLTVTLHGDETGAWLRLAIDRPIAIAIAGPSGDLAGRDAFSLSSSRSARNVAFDLTLVARSNPLGSAALSFGETTLELPAGADGKRVGLHLAGLAADAALHLSPLPLHLVDLGLGGRPATLSLDGEPARTVDLNPDDEGKVSVLVQRDGGRNTLQAIPRLDLRMTADHRVLGDAPAFDVSHVLLDGELGATASPDRLELRRGTFRIDTAPAGHGFAATAGDCITNTRPPVVAWTVGACP